MLFRDRESQNHVCWLLLATVCILIVLISIEHLKKVKVLAQITAFLSIPEGREQTHSDDRGLPIELPFLKQTRNHPSAPDKQLKNDEVPK